MQYCGAVFRVGFEYKLHSYSNRINRSKLQCYSTVVCSEKGLSRSDCDGLKPGITEPRKHHHHHHLLLDHHIGYDCNVKGHLSAIFAVDPFYRPFGRLSVTGPGVEPLLRVLWGRHF